MGSTIVCPNHQKPITSLCLTKENSQIQRLFCSECQTENINITSLENGMKMWQNLENKMIQKFNNFKTQKTSQLDGLHKQFSCYRDAIMVSINKLLETTDDYKHQIMRAIDREINLIKELKENINIKKLLEITLILSQKNDEEDENNNHVGNLNLEQILLKEKQLFAKIKEQNQLIHQEIKSVVKQNKTVVKIKPINYVLKSSIKQQQDCYALTFSNQDKLLITGSGKDIIVWKFDNGKLIQQQILQGHSFNINCICYSKHKNFFISGGCDSQIMIWQEIQNEWKCQQILNEHSNSICNLILDKKDETIFSCSLDNSIKIWKRNEQDNKFQLKQSLNGHSGSVFSISLNDTEQQLISCGRDKQIIIWNNENEQWNKFQSFQNDDYGYRIVYISKICFIWSKYNNGSSQLYLYDRLSQTYKLIRKITQKESNSDGYYLFPAIYNKKQLLIIQKHGRNIFVVRKLSNNKLQLLQTLEFNSNTIFGTITSDTDYLLVWSDKTKEIQIWKNE